MSEDKKLPEIILTPAKTNWIKSELAKTENFLSVQVLFKKIWGAPLTTDQIRTVYDSNREEILELKEALKSSIEKHAWGTPLARMDKFKEIGELAIDGTVVGVDKNGDPIVKPDYKTALECVKACRDEQARKDAYDLDLLKILLANNKIEGPVSSGDAPGTVDADVISSNEAPSKPTVTDTSQYFDFGPQEKEES